MAEKERMCSLHGAMQYQGEHEIVEGLSMLVSSGSHDPCELRAQAA
jgi:hypothetical protein